MGIDFQNVTFKYYKKASSKQLDNVTFHINEKNEFVTILGQTGSGKSTLVQHMNGLLFASSGIVDVFDQKVIKSKKVKLKPIRKHFGKTKEEAYELAINACKLIGIPEDLYERSPFSLSGGQMRRVAIAGALAIDPDILILDEPTVGLDPKGKEELMNLLVDIQNKTHKSIIMITHDMNIVAKYATSIGNESW